jgi:hypothetical protein
MRILVLLIVFLSPLSFAGSWSDVAVPTGIDIERGNGFLVRGDFGNNGGCTQADSVYVQANHPQYKEIYSAAVAAYMAGKKIQLYINDCITRGWYVTADKTFSTLTGGGTFKLVN